MTDQPSSHPETGLAALTALLALNRISTNINQLRLSLGHYRPIGEHDLILLAKRQKGVRAKLVKSNTQRLSRAPLPAIAYGNVGWFIIGRMDGQEALVQLFDQLGEPRIRRVTRDQLNKMWDGTLILLTTREGGAPGQSKFDFTWFIPQIIRYRRLIGEVLLITLCLNLLGLAAPMFFQNVVDKVLVHETADTLIVLSIGYFAVSVWETAFGWLRTKVYSETGQKIDVELGARLYRHLLRLPIGYFEHRRVGDIAARARQVETIREFLTSSSLSVIVDPIFVIVFLVAMLSYSSKLFLISFLTLPAYVFVVWLFSQPLQNSIEQKFERGARNNSFLIESISGIHTLKTAALETQWQERWERQLADYAESSQDVVRLGNTSNQAVQLISKVNLVLILYFGAQAVIEHKMSVGGLIAFNMFAQRVSSPVIRMAQLWQEAQQVRVAVARLGDVLNQPLEKAPGSRSALPSIRGDISFEHVRFRYDLDGSWILNDIHVSIAAGTSLGIVGPSGSGKSSLTKLLQRLYFPASGKITVDGTDIAQIDPSWLRTQIGVVLQENFLFNRSIRDNIALSNPAMPIAAVMEAAKQAGAHEFILRMPHGYDTVLEERGANLSGGQRQRLAIARALFTNPRILIFDEATSALDAESEEVIQNNMKLMSAGRTVIIVAHRLSAVRDCDKLIFMDSGRILEEGTHSELLNIGGRYAGLYRKQAGFIHSERPK